MVQSFEIAVFEGDGIGPEITAPTIDILRRLAGASPDYALDLVDAPAGAALYRDTGVAFPPESLARAREADAILLAAMGLPDVRYKPTAPRSRRRSTCARRSACSPACARCGCGRGRPRRSPCRRTGRSTSC
jgi:isocitrate/isopropylmalate dehydrogenase